MPKPNFLKDLTSKLCEALPSQLQTFKKDFEKTCHTVLTTAFEKLDIVTREEFDTQTKVLIRTRKKLEELEKQFIEIESSLKKRNKAE